VNEKSIRYNATQKYGRDRFSVSQQETQLYDRALKSLLGDEAAEILPQLIEDVVLLSEQNIEIDRSTLKADLVYNVLRKDKPRILNLELQTGYDKDMPVRLLKYHVGLHDKHKLPVISVVIYLFNTTISESPYIELAQQRVTLVRDIDSLDQLAQQLVTAPNETVVKELLDRFAA